MLGLECHCGNIKLKLAEMPVSMTRCNCSICHRLGAWWAYFEPEKVEILTGNEPTATYGWGEKTITYHRCGHCGCTTHYTSQDSDARDLVAVNCRMAPLDQIGYIPVRDFDGLVTWKYLDE